MQPQHRWRSERPHVRSFSCRAGRVQRGGDGVIKKKTPVWPASKSGLWCLSATRPGPHWLFLISLWTVRQPSLLFPPLFISCRHWQSLWQAVFHFLLCPCLPALCCQASPSSPGKKSCPGIRERPDQVSPRQAGKGGWWGGCEERQKRGIETEGKKKDGRAERKGRGDWGWQEACSTWVQAVFVEEHPTC